MGTGDRTDVCVSHSSSLIASLVYNCTANYCILAPLCMQIKCCELLMMTTFDQLGTMSHHLYKVINTVTEVLDIIVLIIVKYRHYMYIPR